jgi:hypothetical protein
MLLFVTYFSDVCRLIFHGNSLNYFWLSQIWAATFLAYFQYAYVRALSDVWCLRRYNFRKNRKNRKKTEKPEKPEKTGKTGKNGKPRKARKGGKKDLKTSKHVELKIRSNY